MITVGGKPPRCCAPAPFADCDEPPKAPDPGADVILLRGDCPAPAPPSFVPVLFGGRGLFRMSLRVEVEEEGVLVGEF